MSTQGGMIEDDDIKNLDQWLQQLTYPGSTPYETASILLKGRGKFENAGFRKAIEYGDEIIPPLQEVSENFAKLDAFNAMLIAEVLAAIRTPLSLQTCRTLYTSAVRLHQLVGAVGLAEHGAVGKLEQEFHIPIDTLSQVKEHVNWETDMTTQKTPPGFTLEIRLAVLSLGKTRAKEAIPYLCRVLRMRAIQQAMSNTHVIHGWICDALQEIGDKEALPILCECLADPKFYAPKCAFNALYSLSPQEAIPLAIQRIQTGIVDKRIPMWEKVLGRSLEEDFQKRQRNTIGTLVQALEAVTGESFDDDYGAWRKWWSEQLDT
jgi:hypothetical protein